MNAAAVIVAAGRSTRFGETLPKQFQSVLGRPLLAWTVSRFEAAKTINSIILVVSEDQLMHVGEGIVEKFGLSKVIKIIVGGETRRESVLNGLEGLSHSTDLVAIHDGARPLVLPTDIDRVVEVASREHAAMLATPLVDTLKRVSKGSIVSTVERDDLYLAQTPQVFDYELILEAHRSITSDTIATDDASLIEGRGFKVRIVEPTGLNLKVTRPDDLLVVEDYLKREQND
ncbi:MAG: 2-C-methyl-D-erythritol 4-phosphate cytidylyltransferase [candidate division Zixibacteria bacterium]|nr:2-C-methyl-D-erythritol 4-phosphate cytidylyltransferase [candidate division Zixibacteria bacterium]